MKLLTKEIEDQIETWTKKRIKFIEFDRLVLEGTILPEEVEVGKVAKREAIKWLKKMRFGGRVPLILVDTVFSLRRRYLPMVRNILRPFYQEFPEEDLCRLATYDPAQLYRKFTPKLLKDNLNYPLSNINRWRNVAELARRFLREYGEDIDAIHNWAININLTSYENDSIIRGLRGLGISAIQYLRMQAGVDTVKPDYRVKKGLGELGFLCSHDVRVIRLCHSLAIELGIKPIELDFILWYAQEKVIL